MERQSSAGACCQYETRVIQSGRDCRDAGWSRVASSQGMAEDRRAGRKRFQVVVASSRTFAPADRARCILRVSRGHWRRDRPSVDAQFDRSRSAPTQPAMGVQVGPRNRALLLRKDCSLCNRFIGRFLHRPALCPRSAHNLARSVEAAFGRLSGVDADRRETLAHRTRRR